MNSLYPVEITTTQFSVIVQFIGSFLADGKTASDGDRPPLSPDMKVIVQQMLLESNASTYFRSRPMQLADEFMQQLDRHFKQKKMVSDYARTLHVTPGYLNYVLKKVTGLSARSHIHRRLIQEAQTMLQTSDISMKGIAYELGFSDIAHFSKFFKSVTGSSFTVFKRERMTMRPAIAAN